MPPGAQFITSRSRHTSPSYYYLPQKHLGRLPRFPRFVAVAVAVAVVAVSRWDFRIAIAVAVS